MVQSWQIEGGPASHLQTTKMMLMVCVSLCCPCPAMQSVIGLAAFWVLLGGLVGVYGFNYVNSKQIKDRP